MLQLIASSQRSAALGRKKERPGAPEAIVPVRVPPAWRWCTCRGRVSVSGLIAEGADVNCHQNHIIIRGCTPLHDANVAG